MTIEKISINGVELPTPSHKGVKESKNKVWSANTGRDDTGMMVGTLLGFKHKLELQWSVLSMAQYKAIEDLTSTDWFTVSYTSIDGTTKSWQGYAGDLNGSIFSWAEGFQHITDVTVDLIER